MKRAVRYAAQDALMRSILDGISVAEEHMGGCCDSGVTEEDVEAMKVQARRVMKFLGYDSFGWLKA